MCVKEENFYFSYFKGHENDFGVMEPSSFFCVINCGKDMINSIIENLRANIKPKSVFIKFPYQKCLKMGHWSNTRVNYEWDNTEETVLKIEEFSFCYSI